MPHKPIRRNVIVDVGAGRGLFAEKLAKRYPKKHIVAIDVESTNPKVRRQTMGEYFNGLNPEQAKTLHTVWLNHVNIRTTQAHKELLEAAKKLPHGSMLVLTVRKQNLEATKHSLEAAGLKIKREQDYNTKMIGSEHTLRFLEESRFEPEKKPIRIIAIKK